jgi:hypothetical protein
VSHGLQSFVQQVATVGVESVELYPCVRTDAVDVQSRSFLLVVSGAFGWEEKSFCLNSIISPCFYQSNW